ncbi:DUF2493 domain-containing protein [Mycolicibacterium sp. S2-37]|uniref:SLOG family protein n=1 Tax=Mycolicibacterium sp. S2-37 TaxID=2810297 RepID=UPI001A952D62|nr:SLOG family protein [Mycolicibacterium sp. S2-37]MBO0676900.1 DUF2493 domain-containing protein [Mycolicibacterium sp. S2-37]
MRVLITGSRDLTDYDAVATLLDEYLTRAILAGDTLTVVHGKARGADSHASTWCWAHGPGHPGVIIEEAHPADWDTHGKAAGIMRNDKMVKLGADVCLAFPRGESRGTRDCIRRAECAGIPVVFG